VLSSGKDMGQRLGLFFGMWDVSFRVLSRAEMVVYYQSTDMYERAFAMLTSRRLHSHQFDSFDRYWSLIDPSVKYGILVSLSSEPFVANGVIFCLLVFGLEGGEVERNVVGESVVLVVGNVCPGDTSAS
jgi:hypothetical protein